MTRPTRRSINEDLHHHFRTPLASRYAGEEMRRLFSERSRILLWRRLWIALAEAQRELGLDIPARPLAALKKQIEHIDFATAAKHEKKLRHDVMAHLHTFAELHPAARPFLHLGATSCFITDNADLILLRQAMELVVGQLVRVMGNLADFAKEHKDTATLGYTHYQPAQPTTVGKRACLWLQDLLFDLEELRRLIDWLPMRGVKGTTGTQASFLALFDGKQKSVRDLDRRIAAKFGFAKTFPVTGQTYPRKVDSQILSALSGLGQSSAKAGNDLRLLAHEREIEEPYEKSQIGSSAMAYKRNPMRSERMCSLARFLVNLVQNSADTASQQWLERTLDDSANRRMVLGEGFLAADAILRVYYSVTRGLVVNEAMIQANLDRELPFLLTEEVLMQATVAGGDRQLLHERIRVHSRAAVERIKSGAADNDLFDRFAKDAAFASIKKQLPRIAKSRALVGRAPQQVTEFLRQHVEPALKKAGAPSSQPQELDV